MINFLSTSSDLPEQLRLMEDLYAQCLIDEMDSKSLNGIWFHIKDLRRQLAFQA